VERFRDQRIKYFRHETNKGIGATRNTGVLNSSGEYIAFLDDDDAWLPQKLALQCAVLDSRPPTVGVVYTARYRFDWRNKAIIGRNVPRYRGDLLDPLRNGNCIGTTSSVMLRKECFEVVGLFDEELVYGEDYDMWVRIARKFQFEYLSEPLAHYSLHDVKLSIDYQKRLRAQERILKKHHAYFASDQRRLAQFHSNLGDLYYCNHDAARGRVAFLKAIKTYPYEVRFYYSLCLSLLGVEAFLKLKRFHSKTDRWFRNSFATSS
jgi:glycosyltransferase involved in cell wall biosynthesis